MPADQFPEDMSEWRECHDCGLVQHLPDLPNGEAASCTRCDATLRRARADWLNVSRACAVLATALFLLSLSLPFVTLHVLGRYATSTLLTGPQMLGERGFPALGMVVFVTLIAAPATKLLLILMVLFGVRSKHPPHWLAWLFGWYEKVSPWAMVEVFLLGAFIAYTRLRDLAVVDVGEAIYALFGTMLTLVALDATMDHDAVWRELEAKGARLDRNATRIERATGPRRIVGCHICSRVTRARDGEACPRCSHIVHHRKKQSVTRVWALLSAATLLYIPANILPVMTVKKLGKGGPTTILNGVQELMAAHLFPLALLVLLASVVVPLMKLFSLAGMLIMTHRKSSRYLHGRTTLFRFVHHVGRWSMIDIFMLTTLVGVVHFGFLSTVLPGMGAVAFCAVVVVTMVATFMFDPRVMWDAVGLEGEES